MPRPLLYPAVLFLLVTIQSSTPRLVRRQASTSFNVGFSQSQYPVSTQSQHSNWYPASNQPQQNLSPYPASTQPQQGFNPYPASFQPPQGLNLNLNIGPSSGPYTGKGITVYKPQKWRLINNRHFYQFSWVRNIFGILVLCCNPLNAVLAINLTMITLTIS